uniref:Uncharacterized protein n=1 Tax=Plectus sambesii TaxID=2011161 RepID=A0A914VPQ0_9BILA
MNTSTGNEAAVNVFAAFSPTVHRRCTFEQTMAQVTLVRIDGEATLLGHIALLVDIVVDDANYLGNVKLALHMQSTLQLGRSNFARWLRLRQIIGDLLCAQLDRVLDVCDRPPLPLSALERRLGLVDLRVVHYCFNRLISGCLNPNTWQPTVGRRWRCGEAALKCALNLLATTGWLLQSDDRGGDEERRLRARVPHYFNVVLARVDTKLGGRHRLSAAVERVQTTRHHLS